MSNSVLEDLKDLSGSWSDAEIASGGGFFELPEGSFNAKITDCEIGYSKQGNLQIVYEITLTTGEYKNKVVKKFANLSDPDKAGYTKKDLSILECTIPDDLMDLPEILDTEAIGREVIINSVKSKGKDDKVYTNIYFEKVIKNSVVEEEEKEKEKATETERPVDDVVEEEVKKSKVKKTKSMEGKTVEFDDEDGEKIQGKCICDDANENDIEVETADEVWSIERKNAAVIIQTRRSRAK